MKKRSGQDVAVLLLSALVVLLAIAVAVVNIFGIRIHPAPQAPEEVQTTPQVSPQGFQFSDTPEMILGSGESGGRGEKADIPVGSGSVSMNLVTGSFSQRGGPDFTLYIDKSTFELTEMDGRCYFCLSGDFSADLYLELTYLDGAQAETLAQTLLDDYGNVTEPENRGTVQLGDYEAVNVRGGGLETTLDAYIIQTERGCVTLVRCSPGGTMQSYTDQLAASMATLSLVEN